jgi:hypothetical protein
MGGLHFGSVFWSHPKLLAAAEKIDRQKLAVKTC